MISYCWAEKSISKPIFECLTKKGYRVWFDENDMHGSTLTAMARAIQNSQCIIICMSENYEKSNSCRHEAEYAFVLQRHIIPILAQSKYKARDWLGFVIGAALYINFMKYDFDKAVGMLEEEIKHIDKTDGVTNHDNHSNQDRKTEQSTEHRPTKPRSNEYENKCVDKWTQDDVISWCEANHLPVFSKLLEHYNGTHLLRLHNTSKTSGDNAVFQTLQQDCQRIESKEQVSLSLLEFNRFQSDLEKRIEQDAKLNLKSSTIQQEPARTCSLL